MSEQQELSGQTKKCPKCSEEILASAKVCKHCHADLRDWVSRHPIITILFFIIIVPIIMGSVLSNSVQNKTTQTQSSAPQVQAPLPSLKDQLNSALVAVMPFNGAIGGSFKDSVDHINKELDLFSSWAKLVDQASKSNDKEINDLGNQLKMKATQAQIKEFPVLRKAYGQIADSTSWRANVDVNTSGTGNRIITITGAVFASNANIADFESNIEPELLELRFDRVNYKWIHSTSDVNYYPLPGLKDSELL